MLSGVSNLVLAIWFGVLLTAGYIMEPVLISNTDRITANNIASTLFNVVTIIGLICALVYLVIQFIIKSFKHWLSYLALLLCGLMLMNYFVFLPEISALMNVEKPDGSDLKEHYDLMHTLSISSYMITVLGAAVLVFMCQFELRSKIEKQANTGVNS